MAAWVPLAALVLTVGAGFALTTPAFADEPAFIYDHSCDVAPDRIARATAAATSTSASSRVGAFDAELKATRTSLRHSPVLFAPRALPAFSRSSIDDAATSVIRPYNDQISVGARAIDKRLGANSAPFRGIEATDANARALVTDILENPIRTAFGHRTYDVYNAAGQGARFDVSTNRFITFLDETIATR